MSVSSDLSAMFAIPALTVPVSLGDGNTRGFLDSAGSVVPLAGTEIQRVGTTLYLKTGDLPGLAMGVTLLVGALGAASAAGGRQYRLAQEPEPIEDGLITACILGGGR